MNYQTVFDIATVGYSSWTFPAHGLIFIAIGIVLVFKRKALSGRWWQQNPRVHSAFTFVWLGFAVLWTIGSSVATYGSYHRLASATENGSAEVVEGLVTSFKPMPVTGHAMERFCVSNTCFEYSDFVITGGFNNTSSHGGPIRDGLPVRVAHVNRTIVKLEVAK